MILCNAARKTPDQPSKAYNKFCKMQANAVSAWHDGCALWETCSALTFLGALVNALEAARRVAGGKDRKT